jgi:hypothetical protein
LYFAGIDYEHCFPYNDKFAEKLLHIVRKPGFEGAFISYIESGSLYRNHALSICRFLYFAITGANIDALLFKFTERMPFSIKILFNDDPGLDALCGPSSHVKLRLSQIENRIAFDPHTSSDGAKQSDENTLIDGIMQDINAVLDKLISQICTLKEDGSADETTITHPMMEDTEAILVDLTQIQEKVVKANLPIHNRVKIISIIGTAKGMASGLLKKQKLVENAPNIHDLKIV